MSFLIHSIDEIDPDRINLRITELKTFLEKPTINIRDIFNKKLQTLNEAYTGRIQDNKTDSPFYDRKQKGLEIEYLQDVLKLFHEYKNHSK